jgi:hypothetical protein
MRVNWLVRQLKEVPETVRVESSTAYSRGPGNAELLKAVRENPVLLVGDPSKELWAFRVAANSPAGTKRGTGRRLDLCRDFIAGRVAGGDRRRTQTSGR